MMATKMLPPKRIPAIMMSGLPVSPTMRYPSRNRTSRMSGTMSVALLPSQSPYSMVDFMYLLYRRIFHTIRAAPANIMISITIFISPLLLCAVTAPLPPEHSSAIIVILPYYGQILL